MVDFGRSRVTRALLGLLMLCVVATALPAAADPQDRLEDIRDKQEKVDAKIDALNAQSEDLLDRIGVLDKRRESVDRRVDALDAKLRGLQERINKVEDDLADAQHRISLLTKELQEILEDLDARTDVYSARAIAIYKAGPGVYVDGLLDSETMSELFDRVEYYRASVDADSELIAEIQVLRDETTTTREQVEAERAKIAKNKLQLERDRDEIASVRDEQAVVLAERQSVLSEKRAILAEINSRRDAQERIYAQLERDAAAITNLVAATGSTTGTGVAPIGGGQLAWPIAGTITSPYGPRTHPIFGDVRMHTGIDIGAPYGVPVYAADDGKVLFVGAMSGYGNVVVIDHGNGLATAYNHLAGFTVGTGQTVSRGSQIATNGCSGYCTGPHVHFEVRVNGAPVDPMPYLE